MKLYLALITTIVSVSFYTSLSHAKSVLKFENAKIFAPLKGSNATAGYVDIKNTTDNEVEISLKEVEKFKAAETHETVEEAGKMSMKKVESFKIPSKGTLTLKPGGRHLMLFDPTDSISAGSNLIVKFLVNGKVESVKFKVTPRQ